MTDLRGSLQESLGSAYTLERELGGGGMSRVFLAMESALNRRVVVKLLSPDLAVGVSVDRFKREIQLAAALQHPHIVPVLAAGDTGGLPWYTMPFVEGESLRARLARGPMSIGETVGILRDVAKALAFAHAHGVVHRDIKPDNVLLAGGSATVADFGIAKAISAARTGTAGGTLTQLGTALGTPTYMAPEQAAGDPATDHRADLYAFGVMAYEMLAGRAPFTGLTPQRLLAAHMAEMPASVASLRADVPSAMAELVMRCLEKEADRRPQDAGDIVRYLDTITSGSGQVAAPAALLGGHVGLPKALALWAAAVVAAGVLAKAATVGIGLPDWVFPGTLAVLAMGLPAILATAWVQRTTHRALTATPKLTPGGTPVGQGTLATMAIKASPHVSWRRTAMGGVIALAVLVVGTGGWMTMRAMGIGPAASLMSSGKMGERDRVILAEFRSPANDSLLGPTVTEAFRTDLGQSRNLSVMPANAVRAALQRMQRPTNVRIDYAIAREIATREGIKAVIDGEVVALGGSYVLSARLVSAQSGEELAAFRQTAEDAKDIIPAISRLSKDVRSELGESLRAVQNARTLEKVTTPSLEALQAYVAANRAVELDGDFARFDELMNQAITLDTGFAMAYRKLAIELRNRGLQRQRAESLLQKAYDNVDRLSETERYIMLGSYWNQGPKPDQDKAAAAYESLLEIDPENTTGLNNLATIYHDRREYVKMAELAGRAIEVQPTAAVFYINRVHALLHLGKRSGADSAIAIATRNIPRNPQLTFIRAEVAIEERNYGEAARLLDSLVAARPNDVPIRAGVSFQQANLEEMQGRLGGLTRRMATARTLGRQLGNPQAALHAILDSIYVDAWYRGDHARAVRELDRVVALPLFDSLPPTLRPYDNLVESYAVAGRPDKAREMLQVMERMEDWQTKEGQARLRFLRGLIARAEKRWDESLAELRASDEGGCDVCILPELALTYDLAGNADSTIALLERFVTGRAIPIGYRATWIALSYKRLGELYDQKGDAKRAASSYSQFVDLWKDADPELQPRVTRARDRLRELQRRGG